MILPMAGSDPRPPLVRVFDRHAPAAGFHSTHLPQLTLHRFVAPMRRSAVLYEPSLCMVVQGSKRAYFGGRAYDYNPMCYLVSSLPLPVEAEIRDATPAHPVLAVVMTLDMAQVAQLILEMGEAARPAPRGEIMPLYTSPISGELERAVSNLIETANDVTKCRVLGAGAVREVLYHLALGEQGGCLRAMALRDVAVQRVARAVRYVHEHFAESIDIGTLAKTTGMSPSTLHHHFKEVTTYSPIQYQKRVRLHRARVLMLTDGLNASEAAFQVGYNSASQFSREFKVVFGESPSQARDGMKRRLGAAVAGGRDDSMGSAPTP